MQTNPVSSRAELLNSCATHSRRLCLFGCMATLAGIGALIACATISGNTNAFMAPWGNPDYALDPRKLTAAYGCAFGFGSLFLVAGVGAAVYGRKTNTKKAQVMAAVMLAVAALAIVYGTALCHIKSRSSPTWNFDGTTDANGYSNYVDLLRPSGFALTGWNVAGGILVGGGLLMSAAGVVGHYESARRMKQPADRATAIG
jgi:hypothetical protein